MPDDPKKPQDGEQDPKPAQPPTHEPGEYQGDEGGGTTDPPTPPGGPPKVP